MAIKQIDFRPKAKTSLIDIANTGLGAVKTVAGIAESADSLFGSKPAATPDIFTGKGMQSATDDVMAKFFRRRNAY